MHEMSVLLKSEELAKDVAGAEALLQRHNEHKVCWEWYSEISVSVDTKS